MARKREAKNFNWNLPLENLLAVDSESGKFPKGISLVAVEKNFSTNKIRNFSASKFWFGFYWWIDDGPRITKGHGTSQSWSTYSFNLLGVGGCGAEGGRAGWGWGWGWGGRGQGEGGGKDIFERPLASYQGQGVDVMSRSHGNFARKKCDKDILPLSRIGDYPPPPAPPTRLGYRT